MAAGQTFIGRRFGRLFVLDRAENRGHRARFRCKCDCGEIKVVLAGSLRSGGSRSCGCLRKEVAKQRATTHGEGSKKKGVSPEYRAWGNMIQRCCNKKLPNFEYYGGRGILVAKIFRKSFEAFLLEIGKRPGPGYSVGRIENNLGYAPGNIRWETKAQQNRNTRRNVLITFQGKTQTLTDWSQELRMPYEALRKRLRFWKDVGRSFTTPIRKVCRNAC
jgi:hypothetical protein